MIKSVLACLIFSSLNTTIVHSQSKKVIIEKLTKENDSLSFLLDSLRNDFSQTTLDFVLEQKELKRQVTYLQYKFDSLQLSHKKLSRQFNDSAKAHSSQLQKWSAINAEYLAYSWTNELNIFLRAIENQTCDSMFRFIDMNYLDEDLVLEFMTIPEEDFFIFELGEQEKFNYIGKNFIRMAMRPEIRGLNFRVCPVFGEWIDAQCSVKIKLKPYFLSMCVGEDDFTFEITIVHEYHQGGGGNDHITFSKLRNGKIRLSYYERSGGGF